MISKCFNPSCQAQFHTLRLGRLYIIEPSRSTKFVWFCEECCKRFAIDRNGTMVPLVKAMAPPAMTNAASLSRGRP